MPENRPDFTVEKTKDFRELYANHIRFESSVWNARMLLGTLDQTTTPATIHMHSALDVPWAQAKLMAYFLQVHVLFQEQMAGKIRIPEGILPPRLDEVSPDLKQAPGGQEFLERIGKLRDELL
jgi:hypothetical protein